MERAGMVHALQTIQGLLKPGGHLIDIHPGTSRPEIFARTKAQAQFIGYLEESDDRIEYVQAEAALKQSIEDGTFLLEYQDQFTFSAYTDTIQSLENYLAEKWKDAILIPAVVSKALALQETPVGVEEIVLKEQVHIARLRSPGPR
jgi:hypothetical protein